MVLQSCAGFLLPFGNVFPTCHASELGGGVSLSLVTQELKLKKKKKRAGGKLSHKHVKNLTEDPPIT